MRIAVTRPREEGERTAHKLAALGHDAVIAPLFEIVPLVADEAPVTDAIVLTSLQAVAHFPPHWRSRHQGQVLCVGDRTAERARAAGFQRVLSADGDVHALVRLIRHTLPAGQTLLHGCGQDVVADLQALLPEYRLYSRKLYAACQVGECPEGLKGPLDAVLHYSPRAAKAFATLCPHHLAAIRHYCLSAQVAQALREAGASVLIAQEPREDSLLALLSP